MSESPEEHRSGSPLPELAAAITAGAVRLAAATAAWLRLIAEFDQREGWHGYGITSCAHWLAWQCGLSPGAAREHVRVARALAVAATDRDGVRGGAAVLLQGAGADADRGARQRGFPAGGSARTDRLAGRTHRAAVATGRTARRRRRHWPTRPSPSTTGGTRQECSTVKLRMSTEPGAAFLAAIESLAERDARRERAQEKKARAARGEPEPTGRRRPRPANAPRPAAWPP